MFRQLCILGLVALIGCKDEPPPRVEAPDVASAAPASARPPASAKAPEKAAPAMYLVARAPGSIFEELAPMIADNPDVAALIEKCAVALDAIEGVDVAFAPPDRFRAELRGKLPQKAVTCVLETLKVERLDVETFAGGLRLGTAAGMSDAGKTVLGLVDGRPKDAAYVSVRLGASPAWTFELAIGEDVSATLASTPEALDALLAWWTAAKAAKASLVPELKQLDLVKRDGKLAMEVGGGGWDDVDKAVALAMALREHVVESWRVPSGSMLPTLVLGDHFFVDKTGRDAGRGDVIVFPYPENPAQSFVKRVIAERGDTLEVLDGRPIVNGLMLPHCKVGELTMPGMTRPQHVYLEYLADRAYLTGYDEAPTSTSCKTDADCAPGRVCRADHCGILQGPFKAAATEAWVLGDNRNNSHDSRSWNAGAGAGVPLADVTGRATLLYWNMTATDRVLSRVDEPRLPVADTKAAAQLSQCLAKRPPLAETTPSKR